MTHPSPYPVLWRTVLGGLCAETPGGTVFIADNRLHRYYDQVADGGYVLDLRPVEDVGELVSLPLLGLELSPGAVAARDPAYRGLDRVSLTEWVDLRRQLGARVGRRREGWVVWEDGQKEVVTG